MGPGRSSTISIQLCRRDTVHLSPLQKDRTVCIDTDINPHRRYASQDDNHRTSGGTTSQSSWICCSLRRAFAKRSSCPAHNTHGHYDVRACAVMYRLETGAMCFVRENRLVLYLDTCLPE